MPDSLTHNIANDIIQGKISYNINFYIIFFLISLSATAAFSFFSGLFQKKGEQTATKADLNNLVKQIEATTKAQEEIKTSIAHLDWSQREWKKLRITKLEELTTSLYKYRNEISLLYKKLSNDKIDIKNKKQIVNNPPRWNGIVIATLFFPELKDKVYQLDELINYQNLLFLEICSLEEPMQKTDTAKLFTESSKKHYEINKGNF
ncbi:hypothetical protein BIU88_03545 [Chlorobaculum limnaeum]|uniref:Uncharacterized protein n=1 Tax=Chlorobaculum limnaeum TaxID=274537 RepID=A0A1D8CWM2_CHLLM|nr:hypothetical protein [Chlorobaculum limnaeum]AOS83296.1 hypothetical protein BIU88_03545 [Chlorobaculum limnaeum]